MKNIHETLVQITFATAFLFAICGCASRDNVSVIDAVSRKPIVGAKVMPIYPSFSGGTYETNAKGIAHVGGAGIPRGGYGVQVTAPGYEAYLFDTYPTSENHSGWRWSGNNLVVELTPAALP